MGIYFICLACNPNREYRYLPDREAHARDTHGRVAVVGTGAEDVRWLKDAWRHNAEDWRLSSQGEASMGAGDGSELA